MQSWDLKTAEAEPHQPQILASAEDARLLTLTPWPGDGHPDAMTLEQKAEARRRARRHQA